MYELGAVPVMAAVSTCHRCPLGTGTCAACPQSHLCLLQAPRPLCSSVLQQMPCALISDFPTCLLFTCYCEPLETEHLAWLIPASLELGPARVRADQLPTPMSSSGQRGDCTLLPAAVKTPCTLNHSRIALREDAVRVGKAFMESFSTCVRVSA